MEPYLFNDDCITVMKNLIKLNVKVDMVLADPPYNTTSCKWDKMIPLDQMWDCLNKLIKDNGAICLFGSEPFSSKLRCSNPDMFKYDWIWVKNNSVGFVNAKLKPMNKHEVISVFSKGKTSNGNKNNMIYYPQGLIPYGKESRNGNKKGKDNTYYRKSMKTCNEGGYIQEFTNYPTSVLFFDKVQRAVHPTQKPVELLEYLIKTYSKEGELVLDFCMGSGSTVVACKNTNRNIIGIELDKHYFEIAKERII